MSGAAPHRCHCWRAACHPQACAVWPGNSASWLVRLSPSVWLPSSSPPTHTAAGVEGSWSAGALAPASPACAPPSLSSPAHEHQQTQTSSRPVPRPAYEVLQLTLCVGAQRPHPSTRIQYLHLSQPWSGWNKRWRSGGARPWKWNGSGTDGKGMRRRARAVSQSSVGIRWAKLNQRQWLQALYYHVPIKERKQICYTHSNRHTTAQKFGIIVCIASKQFCTDANS